MCAEGAHASDPLAMPLAAGRKHGWSGRWCRRSDARELLELLLAWAVRADFREHGRRGCIRAHDYFTYYMISGSGSQRAHHLSSRSGPGLQGIGTANGRANRPRCAPRDLKRPRSALAAFHRRIHTILRRSNRLAGKASSSAHVAPCKPRASGADAQGRLSS
jgi:hypothetical protein